MNENSKPVPNWLNGFGTIAHIFFLVSKKVNSVTNIVSITTKGFAIHLRRTLPYNIPRGHKPHRTGAGIHVESKRKRVRVRGGHAKREWLES